MRGLLVVVAAGCGRIGFDAAPVELAVRSATWNTYVTPDGHACDPASRPWSSCVHAGEHPIATATGARACGKLADSLGAFTWTCAITDGVPTYTGTLVMGLRDLVAARGWLPNQVMLDGDASAPAAWWTNPVAELPANIGTGRALLQTPGEILVASTSHTTDGYDLGADGMAIVTLRGAQLTFSGATSSVVSTRDHDFQWIEVNLDSFGANDGIVVANARFSQVYGTTVAHAGTMTTDGNALVVDGTTSSRVRHLIATDARGAGLLVGASAASDDDDFEDLAIASPTREGIRLHIGHRDVFEHVVVANAGLNGVAFGPYCDSGDASDNLMVGLRVVSSENGIFVNSMTNHLVDIIAANNAKVGIDLSNNCGYPSFSTVAGAVSAFNGRGGLETADSDYTIHDVVSIGNAVDSFEVSGQSWWSNLAASDAPSDVVLDMSSTFEGNLLVASATSCANPLAYSGVADATCIPNGNSTAQLHYQGSLLTDFVGPTGSGQQVPGTQFDWLAVADAHQVWGVWSPQRWTSGTGAILDFRLRASATKLRDNTTTVTAANEPFVPGAACPPMGSVLHNFPGGGHPDQTYLANALEISGPSQLGYGPGNHDGLCESGEHCLYAPNFGAYQGEGDLGTCELGGSAVTGVTMYGYASNGVR